MDIYGLFDLIAISFAAIVAFKMKNTESIYLFAFFVTTSILSFFLFETEYFKYWPGIFTGICVLFGSTSYRHPVVLGYAAYLVVIGLNEIATIHIYSELIYLIFAYQLWTIRYGSDHGHYFGHFRPSGSSAARGKSVSKGKS